MKKMMNKKDCHDRSQKVFVAMSGGVDSSVAAALLKKDGYDVVGVFLRLAPSGWQESERAARAVAKKLEISFLVWDWRDEFKKEIIDYFLDEYAAGRTPNPCVACNKIIKFSKFLKEAKKAGADYIATGHYVKLCQEFLKRESIIAKRAEKIIFSRLFQAKDKNKDQSYFLYNLNQKILSKTFFPLGNYTKDEIKKMADDWHLPYLKKESQDICFLKGGHNEFLKKYLKTKKGKIVLDSGEIIGKHEGLHFYTIGQRRGFDKGGGIPFYVVEKNIKKNLLIVANWADEKKFYKKEVKIKNVNWISGNPPDMVKIYKARIRYRQPLQSCRLRIRDGELRVVFSRSQRAITPGQSLVIYYGKNLLGGGIIK